MKNAPQTRIIPNWSKSLNRWPRSFGLMILAAAGLVSVASAQTDYSLSNTWSLVGAVDNLDTANDNRGMAYDAFGNQVLVVNKSTKTIGVYDGTLGTPTDSISFSSLSGGNFVVSKIGFGTDGILYGANLNTGVSGTSPFKLYSWTSFGATPYTAYSTTTNDAVGTFTAANGSIRVGDTFAITGGGTNTMILAGVGTKNDFVLLSTADGSNFTPTVLTVPGLPSPAGGVQFGFAFYTNNTFIVYPNGGSSLYLVQFPANFATLSSPVTGTVLATDTGLSGNWLDFSYDATAGLLAVHGNAASPISLYTLPADNFTELTSLATTNLSFSTSEGINGNETGAIALGGPGLVNAIYTLDTSAGLQATAIDFAPPAPTSYSLANSWSLVGAVDNLDTGNDNRGMTYNAAANEVLVVNKSTKTIGIYDGTLGAPEGSVSFSSLSGGNFVVNKIGFGTDGILYGANLNTTVSGGSPYKLYSWSSYAAPAYTAYATTVSDALGTFTVSGSVRVGDTFAITGGGTGTMILAGVETKNDFVLLSTTDGTNFSPTVLTVAGLPTPTGVQFGFAFYTNNTFLVNPNGNGNLYLVQFPANFASLSSPVTATILATESGVNGSALDLSYNAEAGLLAVHGNAASPISLFSLPADNFTALASLATTNLGFTTSSSINGNETGGIALGGPGLNTAIYTLDTSAGLQATVIGANTTAIPPSITTEPVGGTVYTNIGSFSFSVAATGSLPLSYQWQFNTESNLATATAISGATNAELTLSPLGVAQTGWYDVMISNAGGVTSSIPVLLTVTAPISSTAVSQLWNVPPGSTNYPYLDSTSYDTRGLAYDPITGTVLVADKGAAFGIYVLNANNGTNMFALNTTGVGISGAQFPLDQVGVGDDGVVYAGDLYDTGSTAGSFAIFSWGSVSTSAVPAFAYQGDPGNGSGDRWGDTMAVRGAGVNTEILLGSYDGYLGGPATNAALLTTTDGVDFNSTLLTMTNASGVPAGFSSLGIAFGAGNTFWAKSAGLDLFQIAFDPVTGNCTVQQDISAAANGTSAFSSMSAICLDVQNNLLAGITFNDVPNDLSLFQLSAVTNTPPNMFDQAFFPSYNGNIQFNGATTVKFPRIYSLDVNNGIVALTYSVPSAPFSITSVAKSGSTSIVLTWQSVAGQSYQVQTTSSLAGAWSNLGSSILASGTSTSYTDTSASTTTRFYRVAGK